MKALKARLHLPFTHAFSGLCYIFKERNLLQTIENVTQCGKRMGKQDVAT